jgi:electron transport complex protein RnfE
MFANKNKVFDSAVDALGMGAGFTLALALMATIREVFGNGTFMGFSIPVLADNHISILTMAPGGFFVFGLLIAAVNKFSAHKPKKQEFGCTGCPSAEICSKACLNNGEEVAVND